MQTNFHRRIRHLCRLLAAVLLLTLFSPATLAAGTEPASDRRTIRVAFPTQEGMSYIGHSGKVTGYNYDYLEKISEYTGWEMDYIAYPSADGNEAVGNAISDLMDGNVDLLGPLLKNASTEELFEFPEHSYGTVYTTLCANLDAPLREQNLHEQGVIRVGLWESAETRNSEVLAYLTSEKLTYELVYFESSEEQQQALIDGKVDVISSVSLSPITNTRIVAQFAPRPYYFASTKGNTELIQELDKTIERINLVEPKLQDSLYDTYFRYIDDTFLLTQAQQDTLSAIGTLRVLCVDHDAPYVYRKDGEPSGMVVSILDDFAETAGLQLEYTFCDTRDEARTQLGQSSYDILIGVPMTSSICAEMGFINSAPIIQSALAYVQDPSGPEGDTIAVVSGLDDLIDTSSYANTLLFDTAEECIRAIEKGEADVAAGNRSVMEYYIYEAGSTLVTSLIPGQTQNVSIAVSRACDNVLLKSLNSYIYSLSQASLANYLSSGNQHDNAFSLLLFTRRHPVQSILIVIAVTLVLAAIVSFLLLRASRQRTAMQKQYNAQLREALQIATDANAAKTTFLSNMSHDIRTPMNAVIGFSTLLSREIDDPIKVREYTRKITAASNHLLSLINDILDISKIESGKLTLNQSIFSINDLMDSINVVIQPAAAAKKQSFRITIRDLEHELYIADNVRINQVLINLLSNAVKYTPLGGSVELRVTGKGYSGQFAQVQFEVIDNGYGISKDFQKIIFDPFTRAENSTINREVGTGLGLAITKNIVELMGGRIDLDSTEGKGTTFTVRLSLRIPHEEQDEHFWENHNVSRILLVDDEKDVCDGVIANMADTGVEFDVAYSGERAVELVQQEYQAGRDYSAVIMDWQMPGMNGLDTVREIRKVIPIDTPIIFLTSYDWAEIETEALEIDVDGFLAKPFTVINLKEKLIEVEHFKNSVAQTDVHLDLNGLHFLVAEDNQLNAEIIREILRVEGASSDLAENGQAAADMFLAAPPHTYDAILMDVMMPVLNGYEATRLIRASSHPEADSIPIIAMTANAFVKDVQDALDSGMNAHIAKPVSLETLKNTLASCIRK